MAVYCNILFDSLFQLKFMRWSLHIWCCALAGHHPHTVVAPRSFKVENWGFVSTQHRATIDNVYCATEREDGCASE